MNMSILGSRSLKIILGVAILLAAVGVLVVTAAPQSRALAGLRQAEAAGISALVPGAPQLLSAPCSGGPIIDGITLDECFVENFTVGGANKSITVWYTNNTTTATRTQDGTTYTLSHWVTNDTQPQDVAAWGREAWERYIEIFGRHPYHTGCGDNINVRLEDGIGWAGIAYWASSGKCTIGIDSPTVIAGNAQAVVYHEFQHFLQYAYNDGCYAFLKANYDNGSAAGDAEFVEGYADLAMDAINTATDNSLFNNYVQSYNPLSSFYDKSYWDVFNKYFSEQLGSQWTTADPHYHMDAVRDHYEECDLRDTLYVLDTLVPSLKPGMDEEKLFLDFFAANWAKDWADPATQPELVYLDDDSGPSYGSIGLYKDENISSGAKSWSGEITPDDWAARYYQVRPQSGCDYVTVNVNGTSGAHLGINLMAADTSGATSVERAAWIGEGFVRTFPGYGVFNRVAAIVNAFDNNHNYDVSFTCVAPAIDILEPKQTNFALVGDPASPIAFLARFKVTSDGSPVLGLVESSFTSDTMGDAITIVPGTFTQVGEEYWAIMLPPTKPAGTTFADLRICLDGSICDTETDALLYVNPGNTDFAMVFDGSGSMGWTEEVFGYGTRLENAKKAGTVMADLLQNGDRIAVTSFSAFDNPPGCGLPGGTGNCALDIRTHLNRTDVTVPGTIAATKTAINNVTARDWTPIGAALVDAKNKLQAAPYSINPKHIILLSDGDENVNTLYSGVRTEIINSGVVVDTIRFSDDAPGALLAQIAADTGGSYTYVPTTGGTALAAQTSKSEIAAQLERMNVPETEISRLTADLLPGPLGLDNVYDYYETKGQDASRLYHNNFIFIANNTPQTASQYVDESVNTLRFVVAGKQEDIEFIGGCGGYVRKVDILQPGATQREWIPVSPVSLDFPPPASWDIRNSLYDDVVIIPNPAPGIWQIRTRYYYNLCASGADKGGSSPDQPTDLETDFMMNISANTDIQLSARFLSPIVNNQGNAGDRVPIVATLLGRNGALPGAVFFGVPGVIAGVIQKPGGGELIGLWDDGNHGDGLANDGNYGNEYTKTDFGGTYSLRLVAFWEDPTSGELLTREWNGSFWINGPEINDQDKDGMPDDWERRCKLDLERDDAGEDRDKDGLANISELHYGTIPCDPDTDNGGERDGSEVNNARNPLWEPDDQVRPLGHINVAALNRLIRINWTHPISYTHMIGYISQVPGELGDPVDLGNTGHFTVTNVLNDVPYIVTLAGQNGSAEGEFSEPVEVIPKADPDPPSGAFMINNGAARTNSKLVTLNISSTDTPLEGLAQSANAHLGGQLALMYNEISGDIEMRVSNNAAFAGAVWEPLAPEKAWELAAGPNGYYTVYVQFRDGALNHSYVINDGIEFAGAIFLPMIRR